MGCLGGGSCLGSSPLDHSQEGKQACCGPRHLVGSVSWDALAVLLYEVGPAKVDRVVPLQ
eukprot:6053799-Pyramimonas_sp.AAC.1